jgi:hypothetical protein
VRREIRSVSESDLNDFLDASHVLWEYNDAEGQKKFGEDFHTNSFLLGFHQVDEIATVVCMYVRNCLLVVHKLTFNKSTTSLNSFQVYVLYECM